jgi:hypothetical protein
MSTELRRKKPEFRIQNSESFQSNWSGAGILTSEFCLVLLVQFDNRHFLLYSYKGLASCVFCSRATAL